MSINPEQVRHVAELARLAVKDDEVGELASQLSRILESMNKLRELETDGVEPTSHVLPLANVWREDNPEAGMSPAEALANAPDRDGDLFRVPKVVESGRES